MSSNTANPVEFGRREKPPAPASGPALAGSSQSQPTPLPGQSAPRTSAPTPLSETPSAPRRSRRSRSQFIVFMNFLMTLIVLAVIGAGALLLTGKKAFESPGPAAADTTFVVAPNTGLQRISADLANQGLVSNASIFARGVSLSGNAGALKAGEYEVKAQASMRDIMNSIVSGRSIMHSLTIPEGLTVEQAFQRIAQSDELSGDMPTEMPPEGSLAADTQRFTRGMSRKDIVAKLVADQKRLVESIWATRDPELPISDINEFVTLASIVEKETGVAAERPQVASVFVNRINQGMRLQSDPTILYGLFGGKGRPADRPIYQSDIQKPTPYNTYVIDGLPPGPIANPGRAALEAVANPAKTESLYFVADGTGGHVFASTLAEHNRNVAKWRAIQKERAEQGAAGQPEATPQQ